MAAHLHFEGHDSGEDGPLFDPTAGGNSVHRPVEPALWTHNMVA